jgi:hypothetical protein
MPVTERERKREREKEVFYLGILPILNVSVIGSILICTSLVVMLTYFLLGNKNNHSNYHAIVTECFPTLLP